MEIKNDLSVGILAAGKSTRMGKDKAFLKIYNQTLLHRLLEEFKEFSDLLVSVNKKSKFGEYFDKADKFIEDIHPDTGPIEGIYQILAHSNHEMVFICGVDMPFLKKELVLYMTEFISSDYDCYIMTDKNEIHPLCGIYSRRMLPFLEKSIDIKEYQLKKILNSVKTKYISLETSCFSSTLILNVNTADDYRKHVVPYVFCVSGVKNSGKTTLIEGLISKFTDEGLRVGAIKHDGHDFNLDMEGTDTDRFAKAGAGTIGIFSKCKNVMIEHTQRSITEMLHKIKEVDIVIIEGMKDSSFPKVEVVRENISNKLVCDPKSIICIATNTEIAEQYHKPVFHLDNITSIYEQIKNELQYEGGKP